MTDRFLYLPLKRIYFEQIRDGVKPFEYRRMTQHWTNRLLGKTYTHVEFTCGYPAADDSAKRIRRLYLGYEIHEIMHEHFGQEKVMVFAIKVSPT